MVAEFVPIRQAIRDVCIGWDINGYAEYAFTDQVGLSNALQSTVPTGSYEWYTMPQYKIDALVRPGQLPTLWCNGYAAGGASLKYKPRCGIKIAGVTYVLLEHIPGRCPNVVVRKASMASMLLQCEAIETNATLAFNVMNLSGTMVHSQTLIKTREYDIKMLRVPIEKLLKDRGTLHRLAKLNLIKTHGTASVLRGNVRVWHPNWLRSKVRHRFTMKRSLVQYTLDRFFYRIVG